MDDQTVDRTKGPTADRWRRLSRLPRVGGAIHVLHAACTSSTRHEQEVGRAFGEAGSCSVGLLEPIEFVGELVVDCQGGGIPTRVRREERDAVAGWALTASNQADVG